MNRRRSHVCSRRCSVSSPRRRPVRRGPSRRRSALQLPHREGASLPAREGAVDARPRTGSGSGSPRLRSTPEALRGHRSPRRPGPRRPDGRPRVPTRHARRPAPPAPRCAELSRRPRRSASGSSSQRSSGGRGRCAPTARTGRSDRSALHAPTVVLRRREVRRSARSIRTRAVARTAASGPAGWPPLRP